MLPEVKQLALDLERRYLTSAVKRLTGGFSTFATDVNDRSEWIEYHTPSGCSEASAMVDLFEVDEIARVEQADMVDHLSADKVIAARHPVAIAYRGVIPGQIVH